MPWSFVFQGAPLMANRVGFKARLLERVAIVSSVKRLSF